MSEQLTLNQQPESTKQTSTIPEKGSDAISLNRSAALALCAAGLAISFFLPWATILGSSASGFDLQKMGDEQRLLWLIPAFSAITIIAAIAKSGQRFAGQFTGLLPFAVGVYWFFKLGEDMPKILSYGAYLSLFFGAALFIIPRRMK